MPDFAARPAVALFRARADSEASADRLRRLGFAVACLPVIEVAPLDAAPGRRRYDAVIATSARAFLGDLRIERDSPLFVVGAATARAAARGGWRLAAAPAPDSAGLVETLRREVPTGATVLYLAGRDRKSAIEQALAAAVSLEVVETYAAEARRGWLPAEIEALGACAAGLHYSRRSAALAARLAEASGARERFRLLAHICLSDDAAAPIRALGARTVRTAASPDEEALFATLSESLAVFPSQDPSRI